MGDLENSLLKLSLSQLEKPTPLSQSAIQKIFSLAQQISQAGNPVSTADKGTQTDSLILKIAPPADSDRFSIEHKWMMPLSTKKSKSYSRIRKLCQRLHLVP